LNGAVIDQPAEPLRHSLLGPAELILLGGNPGHLAVGDHPGGHGFEKKFSERHGIDAVGITLMGPYWGCMTSSPFFMAKDLKGPVDLIVGAGVCGIEVEQAGESLGYVRPVRGGGQPLVHRTNHPFWNLALTGPIPGQALVQRCLKPPAGPLQLPLLQLSVHQPLAPAEMRVGGIHKHVLASGKGAFDRPMQKRLQFGPGALNLRIPPQLGPQCIAGDHPCMEQRSEDRGEG